MMRDGAVVARRAHNPKVTGSSPVPATIEKELSKEFLFCFQDVGGARRAIRRVGLINRRSQGRVLFFAIR